MAAGRWIGLCWGTGRSRRVLVGLELSTEEDVLGGAHLRDDDVDKLERAQRGVGRGRYDSAGRRSPRERGFSMSPQSLVMVAKKRREASRGGLVSTGKGKTVEDVGNRWNRLGGEPMERAKTRTGENTFTEPTTGEEMAIEPDPVKS